tara:strand:+ start:303 stop:503 length:201 start_codon:yes stop_codon:yes gene_type:complete
MKDVRPTSIELAKALENFVYHELDVITESDWFQERVAIALKKNFADEEILEKAQKLRDFRKRNRSR